MRHGQEIRALTYQYRKLILTYYAKSDTIIVVLAENNRFYNDKSPKLWYQDWF